MSFDQRMQQTALRLINKRGKSIVYTAITAGVQDEAAGGAVPTTVSTPIKAVVKNSGGKDLINGTLVERSGKSVLIAALSLPTPPAPNDSLTLDGETFLVSAASATYAGELPATYTLQATKG